MDVGAVEPSKATPDGKLKRAEPESPLAEPLLLARPAIVVTTPPDVTDRMVWLKASATSTFPEPSSPMPAGLLNEAEVPVESLEPLVPDPASVVTTAPGTVTCRIK